MDYNCAIIGSSNGRKKADIVLKVAVPVTSVCPCSKEISDYGATISGARWLVAARFHKFIWIEEIVDLVEQAASCDIYSVLKRADEKYVTEKAYNNPKFVEDIVRDVAKTLIEDSNITWFSVSAENFESIHNHSAYAYIEHSRA